MNDPVINETTFGMNAIKVAPDDSTLVAVDAPPTTEAGAVALCVHHLTLAATYFEATPNDLKFLRDAIGKIFDDGRAVAANAFIDALDAHYSHLDPDAEDQQ